MSDLLYAHNLPKSCSVSELAESDADLEDRIAAFLVTRNVRIFRHIQIQAAAGAVTLHGTVQSHHQKQVAQECCRRVAGVLSVVNALDVLRNAPRDWDEFAGSNETHDCLESQSSLCRSR